MANDWNTSIIEEFRANEGRVGGQFEGAPMILLHTTGAKTGKEYITPLMYLADDTNPDRVYVFASKAGAPTSPDWFHNLVANPDVTVELPNEKFEARARVTEEPERERLYRAQAELMPNFADYEKLTTRKIPVVVLERV